MALLTSLSNHNLKDIYNVEEFGLFYQCLPNKTCQLKSENGFGEKLSKICIVNMAAVNAIGDKLPMFVIGKVKKPMVLQENKISTLLLQKSTEKLNGWDIN